MPVKTRVEGTPALLHEQGWILCSCGRSTHLGVSALWMIWSRPKGSASGSSAGGAACADEMTAL